MSEKQKAQGGTTAVAKTNTGRAIAKIEQEFAPILRTSQYLDLSEFIIAIRHAISRDRVYGTGALVAAIESNPESLVSACMNAAVLELNPSPTLGHFYLIPRKGLVEGQLGYKGLVKLVERTGKLLHLRCDVVYEDEYDPDVEFVDQETEKVNHKRRFFGGGQRAEGKAAKIIGAYASAVILDESGKERRITRVLDRGAIDKRKAVAGTSKVWDAWFEEQCRKTAVAALMRDPRMPQLSGKNQERAREILEREQMPAEEREVVKPADARVIDDEPLESEFERLDRDPFPPAADREPGEDG